MKNRIIAVGDTHSRAFWKLIQEKEKWDKFIFIGDYFDSFDITPNEQIKNFQEIGSFYDEYPNKVVLLIGNHDHHYFPFIGDTGTSGYQPAYCFQYGHLLAPRKDQMKMAHAEGEFLFSHAGVGETWLTRNGFADPIPVGTTAEEIADHVWENKPLQFSFTPARMSDYYGDSVTQTPIWIRPQALQKDTGRIRALGIKQVVGHTGMPNINRPEVGSPEYFIDTMGTSKEYLIIEDGKVEVGKL